MNFEKDLVEIKVWRSIEYINKLFSPPKSKNERPSWSFVNYYKINQLSFAKFSDDPTIWQDEFPGIYKID